jgi:hypothetical protein
MVINLDLIKEDLRKTSVSGMCRMRGHLHNASNTAKKPSPTVREGYSG